MEDYEFLLKLSVICTPTIDYNLFFGYEPIDSQPINIFTIIEGKKVKIQLDVLKDLEFRELNTSYISRAKAIIIVFDAEYHNYCEQLSSLLKKNANTIEKKTMIIVGINSEKNEQFNSKDIDKITKEYLPSTEILTFYKEITNIQDIINKTSTIIYNKHFDRDFSELVENMQTTFLENNFISKNLKKIANNLFGKKKTETIHIKQQQKEYRLKDKETIKQEELYLPLDDEEYEDKFFALIKENPDHCFTICKQNLYGDSILHYWVRENEFDKIAKFCKTWLSKCNDVNSFLTGLKLPGKWKNSNGDTPLHIFCTKIDGDDIESFERFINTVIGTDIFDLNYNLVSCASLLADRGDEALVLLMKILDSETIEWDWNNIIENSKESGIFNKLHANNKIPKRYWININNKIEGKPIPEYNEKKLLYLIKNSNTMDKEATELNNNKILSEMEKFYHSFSFNKELTINILKEIIRNKKILLFEKIIDPSSIFYSLISDNDVLLECMKTAASVGGGLQNEQKFIDKILEINKEYQINKEILEIFYYTHSISTICTTNCICLNFFKNFFDQADENSLIEPINNDKEEIILHLISTFSNSFINYYLHIMENKFHKKEDDILKLIHTKNRKGKSSLHVAAENGNLDFIKLLAGKYKKLFISRKDNPYYELHDDNLTKYKKESIIHLAVRSNKKSLEILKFLFSTYSPSIQLGDIKNNTQTTPLFIATKKNEISIVDFLLNKGATPTIVNHLGKSCIHQAAYQINFDLLQLFEKYIDLNDQNENPKQFTPLHFAAGSSLLCDNDRTTSNSALLMQNKKYNLLIIKNIINLLSKQINELDCDHCTPLHIACKLGNFKFIKAFYEIFPGNNLITNVDNMNRTPLHTSIYEGYEDISMFLFSNFQGEKIELLKILDNHSKTILHLSIERNFKKLSQKLFDIYKLYFKPCDYWYNQTNANEFYFQSEPYPHIVPQFTDDQIKIINKSSSSSSSSCTVGEIQLNNNKEKVYWKSSSSSSLSLSNEKIDERVTQNEIMILSKLDQTNKTIQFLGLNSSKLKIFSNNIDKKITLRDFFSKLQENKKKFDQIDFFEFKLQLAIKICKIIANLHAFTGCHILYGDIRLDKFIITSDCSFLNCNHNHNNYIDFKNLNEIQIELIDFKSSSIIQKSSNGKDFLLINRKLINNNETKKYQSPEVLNDNRVGLESDVYSFGLLLYELFTNTMIFNEIYDDDDETKLIYLIKQKNKKINLNSHDNDYNQCFGNNKKKRNSLLKIIQNCLHDEPKKRFDIIKILIELESLIKPNNNPPVFKYANDKFEKPIFIYNENHLIQQFFESSLDVKLVLQCILKVISNCYRFCVEFYHSENGKPKCFYTYQHFCKLIVWWTRNDDDVKDTILNSDNSCHLPLFQYLTDVFMYESEREISDFYPFKIIDNLIFDCSPCNIIGSGTYGTVYKMKLDTDESVAVKIINTEGDLKPSEITFLTLLKHKNLVYFYGIDFEDNQMRLIMELCDDLIVTVKKYSISFKEKLKFCLQICKVLKFLQSFKVVHRDIKVSNVFLKSSKDPNNPNKLIWNAKLGDLGLSVAVNGIDSTQAGTPCYFPPSLFGSDRKNDSHVNQAFSNDHYAFGLLMYEILCEFDFADFVDNNNMALVSEIEEKFIGYIRNNLLHDIEEKLEQFVPEGKNKNQIKTKIFTLIKTCLQEDANKSYDTIYSSLKKIDNLC